MVQSVDELRRTLVGRCPMRVGEENETTAHVVDVHGMRVCEIKAGIGCPSPSALATLLCEAANAAEQLQHEIERYKQTVQRHAGACALDDLTRAARPRD